MMDGLITRNPCDAVEAPHAHKREVIPFSPAQVKALLEAACGDRLEALYVLAVHTGLRQGEILALKCTDLDLEVGTLSVQRSLDADGTFNPPRRIKSRRTLKLTAKAVEALKSHKVAQNEERLRLGSLWQDHALVFSNRVGKPMDHNNLYYREYKPLLARAGLEDEGFTFYSLRHAFATALFEKGEHPKVVQSLLGHSSITQTMDTYSHVMEGMGGDAVDGLDMVVSCGA